MARGIRQWPPSERPRERLLRVGPEGLSDSELLALVLGTARRGVVHTSRDLLHRFGGLHGLGRAKVARLRQIDGIGEARACAIAAAIELGRRSAVETAPKQQPIHNSSQAYSELRTQLIGQRQELFLVLALDARNRPIAQQIVAQGSATSVEVHPREVFHALVAHAAVSGIVAHNHPSGDPEPSELDVTLTQRLKHVAEILGIPLLDHLIVGASCYVSLADRGLL